eukprot:gnl/MRDRNA2_/MRDRNA2_89519_c0_seq1.p3 gnl/MRDRNA2_/MRDRNA2_89519_c0~~gnl/MRDRNA2_/MRDRNA2_89519_c0_seq1.p3  ORF type:complete len:106 (+),score=28.79 gnl/MRDRNA2_/MRDRNA2_89519_c0_seq1:89-406(+)
MRTTNFLLTLVLALAPAMCSARLKSKAPVTKGDLAKRDNEKVPGCTNDEYERFKIIVCGETLTKCELEWCETYKHEWKIKFGACNTVGCPAGEVPAEEEGPPADE